MKTLIKTVIALGLLITSLAACGPGGDGKASGPFLKPPLRNGEVFTYRLTTGSGAQGKAVFRIEKDRRRPFGFVLTNTGAIPALLDSVAVSRVRPDLRPISTDVKIKNPGGVFAFKASYRGDKLLINRSGQAPMTIKLAGPTYDFGEFLTLLRSLDFRVGAEYTVREAWPSLGQVFESRVAVEHVEEIRVPAGAFRAYHVTHTFGAATGGDQAVYHSWYEAAAPHRLIKHNGGAVLYELLPSGRK